MPPAQGRRLSIVVPVFNRAGGLAELVRRCLALAGKLPAVDRVEVVLVDDASRDGSAAAIDALARAHPGAVAGLYHMRNYGQHAATLTGVRAARGDLVATIDDDLQFPPEELSGLLARLDAGGLDLVYGHSDARRHGLLRDLASSAARRTAGVLLGGQVWARFSSFRLLTREAAAHLAALSAPDLYIDMVLPWITTRVGHATFRGAPDTARSNYAPGRLVGHFWRMAISSSVLPLRLALLLGCLLAAAGLAYATLVVWAVLVRGQLMPWGFPTVITSVLLLSGTQLVFLGVVGEYVGRLYLGWYGKPQALLRSAGPGPAPPPAPTPAGEGSA